MRIFCRVLGFITILSVAVGLLCGPGLSASKTDPFVFGLLLLESRDDRGWSQAHYEAGVYAERKLPGTKMIYMENVNPRDRPGLDISAMVNDLVARGAKLIIAASYDMRDGILKAAREHPDVCFVHIAGDDVLTGNAPGNMSNLMCRKYWSSLMAGLAAGLTTRSGKIGYVGAKIGSETLRITSSAYLGACYAWNQILHRDLKELKFEVSWIGSWYYVPGKTPHPAEVTQSFIDSGCDVILCGIDSPDVLKVAGRNRKKGREVWAIGANYREACSVAPEACLGTQVLNWAPGYMKLIRAARAGTCAHQWLWLGPDWNDIDSSDTSSAGFAPGPVLTPKVRQALRKFISDVGRGKIQPFKGPLFYQDSAPFVKDGECATDEQLWNMKQLLRGMEDTSNKELRK